MSQDNKKDMSQYFFRASAADFMKIPGSPIAYWLEENALNAFGDTQIGNIATFRAGLQTGDNETFLRFWHEVSRNNFMPECKSREESVATGVKWFPHNKGGGFRKWHGNKEYVINWLNDGAEIKQKKESDLRSGKITANNSKCWNQDFYFKDGLTWSSLSSADFSLRDNGYGFLFDTKGQMLFSECQTSKKILLGFLNSNVAHYFLLALAPTLDFNGGVVSKLPLLECQDDNDFTDSLTELSRLDWDSSEISWDFVGLYIIKADSVSLNESYRLAHTYWYNMTRKMQELEEDNNRVFIEAYGLKNELTPVVPLEDISINCNPHYRYGGKLTDQEREDRLQSDTLAELVSYAMGCIMGRYSLDKPGLILASQGETIQGYLAKIPEPRFMPDDDAILPLTDLEWFPDDASNRFREFVSTVWGEEHLQQNLDFVAESLCLHAIKPRRGESAMDTIRRYLSTQFYKDHLKTYKKRPIYWLFSSGKQKAFECLVYLHRYNEGTLARMRTEYVIPLTAKLATYVDKLEQDKEASSSAAETKRLEKEIAALHKQQAELASFDEKLRHYADMRISLDLDDGVKVNYGKFGDLLANVKDVTGEKPQ